MDDIKLRKVGEPKDNVLPRGVHMVRMEGRVIFVKSRAGMLMPLPQDEQERLARECGLING